MTEILISATVLITAVILLRALFKNRISRRLQYALWLVVAIRLVLPIQLGTSPISIQRMDAEKLEAAITQTTREPISGPSYTVIYSQVAEEYATVGQDIQAPAIRHEIEVETAQRITVPTVGDITNMVWTVGAAVMAVWFLFVNLRFRRTLRKNATEIAVPGCDIPVKVCPTLPSPCLSGLFRPTVYLTESCTDDSQRLRHILAHELTHLRHGDLIWSGLRSILLCVYWFHPLVWVAAVLSKRDCELACDEGALARLGEDQRIAYGKTLLDTVARDPSPNHLLETATSMNETKKQLKERVNFIVKKPKFYLLLTVCLLLIIAVTIGCTFTGAPDPSTEPTETTQPTEPTETTVPIETTQPSQFDQALMDEITTLFTGYYNMNMPTNWYNAATLATFDSPQDIDAYDLFEVGTGVPADWRLTDEELDYLRSTTYFDEGYARCRMSREYVENVLDQYFGLTTTDLKTESKNFTYWEKTDCYYVISEGHAAMDFRLLGAVRQEDGTILFEYYYPYSVINYVTIYETVIRPVDGGYHVLSNRIIEKSNLNPDAELVTEFRPDPLILSFSDPFLNTNILFTALNSSYSTPADVNLLMLFYCLPTEELTQEEIDFAVSNGLRPDIAPIHRYSVSTMDYVLQRYFGITFEECNGVGLDQMLYNPDTDCYYHVHGDSMFVNPNPTEIQQAEDGTLTIHYQDFVDYKFQSMVVTIIPNAGGGYQILSNVPVLKPTDTSWQPAKKTSKSYDEYFSLTRQLGYKQVSNDLTWIGADGANYSLLQKETGLHILNESQEILWTVPGTESPSGIQWLVCDGEWAYGVLNNRLLRAELLTGNQESLFTGEKLLCGSMDNKAANLMVCDRAYLLFAAVSNGKGCIYRLYLPTMTLDLICNEIPADTLPCWLEIWTPEDNQYVPFMFLNPQLQPILYDTLADPDSPYRKVIEAWPDTVEEPMIVDMSAAWDIPNLMTTYQYHSSLEWLIISLQYDNQLPGSVLWVYSQQEDAITQKTGMLHTGNHGFQGIWTDEFPSRS